MKISAISLETSRSDRAKRNTCILTSYPTGLVLGQWDSMHTEEKSTQSEMVSRVHKPERQTTSPEHSYAKVKSNTSSISSAYYYASVNAVKIYANVSFVSRLYNDVAVQTENSELRGELRSTYCRQFSVCYQSWWILQRLNCPSPRCLSTNTGAITKVDS
ncbi:unnamed protein product [Dicrocoelium dendriticum]|nr:unnamed protein product [Dicrocoelium dendriticum]